MLLDLRALSRLDLHVERIIPKPYNTPKNRLIINRFLAVLLNLAAVSALIAVFLVYLLSHDLSTYLPLLIIVSVVSLYNILLFLILFYSNLNENYLKQPLAALDTTNEIYYYEYCDICKSFKLNRTHHSKKIGICVYKFDHFCKWLGIIINYSNYKVFLQYIALNILNSLIIFVVSLYRLVMLRKWLGLSIMYLSLSSLALLSLTSLLAIHLRLIYENQTTIEFLNYRWLKKNDKQNGVVYNPIFKINGELKYIDIKESKHIYRRGGTVRNIIDALGPMNYKVLLPTLNNFHSLNLEVSDSIKKKYNAV